ncbi:MAG: cyclodeaminase/cyclohydrolase family protein, partial [Bacillota bacterium]
MEKELLAEMTVKRFVAELGAKSATPGGGAAAGISGALAASLAQMVGNLTVGRKKFAAVNDEMAAIVQRAGQLAEEFLAEMDADAAAYDTVMAAYGLPKSTDAEQAVRQATIDKAFIEAARVPARTARLCLPVLELAKQAAQNGNPNAASDAMVSAYLAEAACKSALANVRTNL